MRAALVEAWPGLSHYFGLHPWDVPELSLPELNQYVQALTEINNDARRAQRKR